MNNRMKNIEQIKQHLLISGIPEEKVNDLFNQFNDLERKVNAKQATTNEVQSLVQEIFDIMSFVQDSPESVDRFTKAIYKLSKNYTVFFALFVQAFKEAKEDQIKYAQVDSLKEQVTNSAFYTKYLRNALILPMMLEISHTTEYSFTSKYFGTIPIITLDSQTNSLATNVLSKMDDFLTFTMADIEKYTRDIAALQAYALSFGYLNRENLVTLSPSEKLFFHYLEEATNHKPSEQARNVSPKLMVAMDDVMYLFSSCSDMPDNFLLRGGTLKDRQTIILSISKDTSVQNLLKTLIHEMQHLYNALYQTEELVDVPIELSEQALNEFLRISNFLQMSNESRLVASILNDIDEVLKKIAAYPPKERTLDELSAHLTLLLFYYSPYRIRYTINLILDSFAITTDVISQYVSNAFQLIEHAIRHLSLSLYNFKFDRMLLVAERLAEKNANFKEFHRNMKLSKAKFKDSWDECLKGARYIQDACNDLIEAARISDDTHFRRQIPARDNEAVFQSAYSLHQQAILGNNELIQFLLHVDNKKIDDDDKDGLTPLLYAIIHNHLATVKMLLKNGASLDWQGSIDGVKNSTLLHVAARYGSYDIIPLLVKKGLAVVVQDEEKQTPLMLLGKQIVVACNAQVSEDAYKQSIAALTALLCQSDEQAIPSSKKYPGLLFINSLMGFRKNVALLFLLHESAALQAFGQNLPSALILHIALQIDGYVPNQSYKNCYRDIILELLKNNISLSQFTTQGINASYLELQEFVKNGKQSLVTIIGDELAKLLPTNFIFADKVTNPTAEPSSEEKRNHLRTYYSPRSLFMGAKSLAAITLAKRQLQSTKETAKSNEKMMSERRLVIQEWKQKIADEKRDEGLSTAILQACNELGISKIDDHTYHKFAAVLTQLVIKEKKTPATYTPGMFSKELKRSYQEAIQDSQNLNPRPNLDSNRR